MLNQPGFDFSFSGLKTAVMLQIRACEGEGTIDRQRPHLAASFQRAAIDTLVARTLGAARKERSNSIVVAGGVGANVILRAELARRFQGKVFYPRPEFCTDNGAMIAIAGAFRMADAASPGQIEARARWPLESLSPPANGPADTEHTG
jgi:N6-L-threonylcarbamoyladenine synthase